MPGLRRMGALSDSNTATDAKLHALQEVARTHNIELSIHQVARGEEIAAAIDAAQLSGATALNVLASPMLFIYRPLIMDRVAVLRLPAIYEWPEMAEEGGFAGYGPRFMKLPDVLGLAVKLLLGAKPADLPVEQPTKFELAINLKTAEALGLTVPPSLLARADEVIE
jgi:putative tryptophan/tyrosine transport system substrate-binding protein